MTTVSGRERILADADRTSCMPLKRVGPALGGAGDATVAIT
jgi:hypothetical protein